MAAACNNAHPSTSAFLQPPPSPAPPGRPPGPPRHSRPNTPPSGGDGEPTHPRSGRRGSTSPPRGAAGAARRLAWRWVGLSSLGAGVPLPAARISGRARMTAEGRWCRVTGTPSGHTSPAAARPPQAAPRGSASPPPSSHAPAWCCASVSVPSVAGTCSPRSRPPHGSPRPPGASSLSPCCPPVSCRRCSRTTMSSRVASLPRFETPACHGR